MLNKLLDRQFLLETIKFGLVGVMNTIIGYGLYYIFIKLNINYMVSLLVSHIIGSTNSYFWNKHFTFKSKKRSWSEVLRFISVYAVTFVLNSAILSFLVEYVKMGKEEGGFVALIIVTAVSFFGHKFWSFKKNR